MFLFSTWFIWSGRFLLNVMGSTFLDTLSQQSGFNQSFATTTHVSYYWHHHLVVSGSAEQNCLKNCGKKFLLYKKFGRNFQKWFYIPNYLKFSKTELKKSQTKKVAYSLILSLTPKGEFHYPTSFIIHSSRVI